MKSRNSGKLSKTAGAIALAAMAAGTAGCASQQPREIGACTVIGAALGSGLGAMGGYLIGDKTNGGNSPRDDTRNTLSALGGAAVGAIAGGVAGHYLCDNVIKPPPPPPPPAPPPPPPPLPPPPHVAERIVLRGVHFDFNKADIRPVDAAVLDEAVEALQQHKNVRIYVNGYCDAIGSVEYNQKLSGSRADAVAEYLETHGISATRMVTQGFGKTHFIATNDTDEGRAQNRRVELVPIE